MVCFCPYMVDYSGDGWTCVPRSYYNGTSDMLDHLDEEEAQGVLTNSRNKV